MVLLQARRFRIRAEACHQVPFSTRPIDGTRHTSDKSFRRCKRTSPHGCITWEPGSVSEVCI